MSQVGISNSEAMNSYACELAWGIGHHPEMGYAKAESSSARDRGIIGHEALQVYYEGLRDGKAHDTSAHAALQVIQKKREREIMAGDFSDDERLEMLNWLYVALERYFKHYEGDSQYWEVLEVEGFHAQETPDETDFYLPSRLDVTIYQKGGKFKGETSPLDHKFTYDFYNSWKLKINSQFPLYILALRASRFAGKPKPVVRRVIVNQIRTRLKKIEDVPTMDLFRRTFQDYTPEQLANTFQNHMKTAVHLAYFKRLPWDEFLAEARIAAGSMACQYCDFKDACLAILEGRSPENAIQATLTRNTYGYPSLEEIRRER